ncbi:hypothetical protein [Arthrobacter sp. Ld5]|uniref:hypothetical protein n=1 Tax=Arthrobacter sp. Ld5 TaxID=649152 RepID=UPI003EBC4496
MLNSPPDLSLGFPSLLKLCSHHRGFCAVVMPAATLSITRATNRPNSLPMVSAKTEVYVQYTAGPQPKPTITAAATGWVHRSSTPRWSRR